MQPADTSYSFRSDTGVPAFNDPEYFTVMDAHCALCARGARWIAHNDKRDEFRIIPMQSELGRALLLHYDLDPDDPSSWLYMERGQAYSSLDAVIRVGRQLGGLWRALILLRAIPKGLQDRLYYFVARNRYRISGHADLCTLPDPDVQRRLIR